MNMKKTYIVPATKLYQLSSKKSILTTSFMGVGDNISEGQADARELSDDSWDDYE